MKDTLASFLALTLAIVVASPLRAQVPFEVAPNDLQLSPPPPVLGVPFEVDTVAFAYNPTHDQVLAVFDASGELAGPGWAGFQVFALRLDVATGKPLDAAPIWISSGLAPGYVDAVFPRVAYNPDADEYLVVFQSGGVPGDSVEIYGRRLDGATALPVGPAYLPISQTGSVAYYSYTSRDPDVAYNPSAREYLVAWYADIGPIDVWKRETEVFVQRLDGFTAAEVGPDDVRITHCGPDNDPSWHAGGARIAYNPDADEYLIAYTATTGMVGSNEFGDVFGQRLDGTTGAEVGADDFRIGTTGTDADQLGGGGASVAYSRTAKRYLVTWLAALSYDPYQTEHFGQLLDGATGTEVGPDDAQLSFLVQSPTAKGGGRYGTVVANEDLGNFLVTYSGKDTAVFDSVMEIYAELVSAVDASLVGGPALKVSDADPLMTALPYAQLVSAVHADGGRSFLGWIHDVDFDSSRLVAQGLYACMSTLPGSETLRLGTPPNPPALQPGQDGPPRIGNDWRPHVSHVNFLPAAVLDALVVSATALDVPTPFGTLLLDPAGGPVLIAPASEPFALAVPAECSLVGATATSQAASITPAGVVGLTNALDLVLGTP